MLRRILLALAVLAVSAPAAAANCGGRVIADYLDDGVIQGSYPASCYAQALGELPPDAQNYTDAAAAIKAAAAAARGGGSGGGATSSAVTGPAATPATTGQRTTPRTTPATVPTPPSTAAGDLTPIDTSDGGSSTAVASALPSGGGKGGGGGVPTVVVVLGGLAAALVVVGGGGLYVQSRLRAAPGAPLDPDTGDHDPLPE